MENKIFEYDIVILGGLGHVGLPLGIVFAGKGQKVCLYDINKNAIEEVKKGKMPFIEYGAEPILAEVLKNGNLQISMQKEDIAKAKYVIVAIGTPIDEFLNPKTRQFLEFFESIKPYLSPEQTIIIRSTVYPNTCVQILRVLGENVSWKISYCPERIVQGYSVKELNELPQIVAGLSEDAQESAAKLFGILSPKIIKTSMGEAELVKLFSNAWRYIQFAATNQFYMIAENFGVDYNKVRFALTEGYGRTASLPGAGFAAGPCLLKDTMQLASFDSSQFLLGHSAMLVNEGLPNFVVEKIRKKHDLSKISVGILGMAFKAEIDDIRDSLSFKLWKILRFHGTNVYCSDEYAQNPEFVTKEEVAQKSDVIIIGVPHKAYQTLNIPDKTEVIDLWNIIKK
ncbi:MAG: nucleotide sugar dehydrogenase [Cytophagales bacterium]|nr:nucleotide sugar dehydrogenase [Cytophagales bacterium]